MKEILLFNENLSKMFSIYVTILCSSMCFSGVLLVIKHEQQALIIGIWEMKGGPGWRDI